MNAMTRRTFTASLAAIPAIEAPGAPSAAAPASSNIPQLIEAHKAAAAAAEAAHTEEGRLYAEYQRTLPRIEVRLPFGSGHADFAPDHGITARDAAKREFAMARNGLAWFEKRGFDKRAVDTMRTKIAVEETAFKNALEAAARHLADHSALCGYSQAVRELEAADDAEIADLQALIEAEPTDLASANTKADYLAAILAA